MLTTACFDQIPELEPLRIPGGGAYSRRSFPIDWLGPPVYANRRDMSIEKTGKKRNTYTEISSASFTQALIETPP